MLGDVLTFKRKEVVMLKFMLSKCYVWVINNMVNITRIRKESRCAGIRRTPWKITQPDSVRM
jgi:hypothetical protein